MTASTPIKVTFLGETRRLPGDSLPIHDFDAFFAALTALFPPTTRPLLLQYKDSDGDTVTIRSSSELRESFLEREGPKATPFDLVVDGQSAIHVDRSGPVGGPAPSAPPEPSPEPKPKAKAKGKQTNRAKGGPNAQAYITQATDLIRIGSLDEAEGVLVRAMEQYDGNPLIHYNLACLHAKRGSVEPSLASLSGAVDRGFKKLKHALLDRDLDGIVKTKEYGNLILQVAKEKYSRGAAQKGVLTFGQFLAGRLTHFRKGNDQGRMMTFIECCLEDPEVDQVGPLMFHASAVAAAAGENERALGYLRRACDAGFVCATKVMKEPQFAALREAGSLAPILADMKEARARNRKGGAAVSSDEDEVAPPPLNPSSARGAALLAPGSPPPPPLFPAPGSPPPPLLPGGGPPADLLPTPLGMGHVGLPYQKEVDEVLKLGYAVPPEDLRLMLISVGGSVEAAIAQLVPPAPQS